MFTNIISYCIIFTNIYAYYGLKSRILDLCNRHCIVAWESISYPTWNRYLYVTPESVRNRVRKGRVSYVTLAGCKISTTCHRFYSSFNFNALLFGISIRGASPSLSLWGYKEMARPGELKSKLEAPRRVGFWGRGYSPPHQLGGLGERCKLPGWVRGQAPATWRFITFLATFTFVICCRQSVCRLSTVCRLCVALVRPTQPVEIFGTFCTTFGTMAEDRPRKTPPSGGLNAREVAKYSDFGHRRLYLGSGAR